MTNDTYPMPAHGWTCFHCGETFRTAGLAREHFGATPDEEPSCKLKVTLKEWGLIYELRKATAKVRRLTDRAEALEHQMHAARQGYRRIGGASGPSEASLNYEAMEGRALAAEAIIADIAARWPALVEASSRRVCRREHTEVPA